MVRLRVKRTLFACLGLVWLLFVILLMTPREVLRYAYTLTHQGNHAYFSSNLPSTYKDRKRIALDACVGKSDRYRGNYNEVNYRQHMLYSKSTSFIFCGVEKVGLTFWRRLFMAIDKPGASPFHVKPFHAYATGSVTSLDDLKSAERENAMTSSLKVIFSRDPYERLFSAYLDKFFNPNINYWIAYGSFIIQNYRRDASFFERRCGFNVTFAEFVKYIINIEKGQGEKNEHFTSITEHCRPCGTKFDFIGKMDTFKKDVMFLLDALGLQSLYKDIEHSQTAQLADSFLQVTHLIFNNRYELIEKTKCASFHYSLKRAWRFLQIRGLISMKSKYPFTELDSQNISVDDFLLALKNVATDADDKNAARANKLKVMLDVYSTVDMTDLYALRTIFLPDCEIFGYDCTPSMIFNQSDRHSRDASWLFDLSSV